MMYVIIFNTICSIIAFCCMAAAIFKFRENDFFIRHSMIEYEVAKNKKSFRKNMFWMHLFAFGCACFLLVSMFTRITEGFTPYRNNAATIEATGFDLLFCLGCVKVLLLYKND